MFAEAGVDGYPAGAFFTGEATLSFSPQSRKARADIGQFLGVEELRDRPVSFAYVFSLQGKPLLEQLGVSAEPSIPFQESAAYAQCKKVMRQQGISLGHSRAVRDPRAQRLIDANPNFKYQFWPIAWSLHPADAPFAPHGRVSRYTTRLNVGKGASVKEEARVAFHAGPGVSALVLHRDPHRELVERRAAQRRGRMGAVRAGPAGGHGLRHSHPDLHPLE